MIHRRRFAAAGTLLAVALATGARASQSFATRPIRLLVGFGAGGITDLTARALTDDLAAALGQAVVVENKPGAGGNIATAELARATPDGHTLMLASPGQLVVNPLTQKSLGFDPNTQFTLIGLTNTSPFVLVVPSNSRFKSAAELLDFGRKNPGKLSFASPGLGTTMHIGGEMLNAFAGIAAVHVPYRGGAQSTGDLVAGRVDFMIDSIGAVAPQLEAGQLKVLASASDKRNPRYPDLPALNELLPDVEVSSWLGLVAPPNVPAPIREQLAAALARTVRAPRFSDYIRGRGSSTVNPSPEFFASHLARERRRVEETVVKRGLKLE